jgi:hypothetical protein
VKPSQILAAPEAIALKRANPRRTLLVDVRSHAEAHFTGVPLGVDAHIPFAAPIGKLGRQRAGNAAADGVRAPRRRPADVAPHATRRVGDPDLQQREDGLPRP